MSNDELQKAIDDITSSENSATESVVENNATDMPLTDDVAQQTEDAMNELEKVAAAPVPDISGDSFGMPMMPPNNVADVTEESAAEELKMAAENKKTANLSIGGNSGSVNVAGDQADATNIPVLTTPPASDSVTEAPAENLAPVAPATEMPAEPTMPAPEVAETPDFSASAMTGEEVKMPELSESGPEDPELKEVEIAALLELYPLLEKMNVNAREKFDICMKVIEKTGEKGATSAALSAAKGIQDENERGECLVKLVETIDKM